MPKHSEEARIEYTEQIQAKWNFYQQNLLKKQRRLAYNQKHFDKIPGVQWTIKRQQAGIAKVKLDILNLQMQIDLLIKNKEINEIDYV